jgi:hypothetical protein
VEEIAMKKLKTVADLKTAGVSRQGVIKKKG